MPYGKNLKQFKIKIFNRSQGICFYCQKLMAYKPAQKCDNEFTVEHLIPQSKGGKWNMTNCRAACRKCNEKRKKTPLKEFLNHNQNCICKTPIIKRKINYYICVICNKKYLFTEKK